LLERGAELRDRVRRVDADLRREREPLPADSAEAAVVRENDEVLEEIRRAALDELHAIGVALQRLDLGKFDVCERCASEIEPGRRDATPYTTSCVACAAGA
jgi:RNA polymerase-binding transcription factor DksA